MKTSPNSALAALILFAVAVPLHAVTATWTGAGGTGNWRTTSNWSGSHPYTGSSLRDLLFETSAITELSVNEWTDVGEIRFGSSAPAFTFNILADIRLSINGDIVNHSTVQQVFTLAASDVSGGEGARVSIYQNTAVVGDVKFILQGAQQSGATWTNELSFYDNTSAGSATILNRKSAGLGGDIYFWGSSTAASATIINEAITLGTEAGGRLEFRDNATAGTSTITVGGGSLLYFRDSATAGSAHITVNSGLNEDIFSGDITFMDNSDAGTATLVANGGNGMTDTKISFLGDSDGGSARVILNNGGVLDASGHTANVILNIGSIEGAGSSSYVNLSSTRHVAVGWLNTDTTFAGTFDGNASARFYKVGTGTLTLTANSTSVAAATISAGTLQIGNGGTTGSFAGNIENNARLVFNHSSAKNYSKVISGTGTLTKLGAGTLTLSGANTYSGATIITGGTLKLGSAGTLSNTPSVHIASGATFDVSSVAAGFSFTSGESLSGSGTFAGRAIFTSGSHLSAGTTTGTITFTGGLALNSGTILNFDLGTSSDMIRVSGGTLTGSGSGKITVNLFDSGGFTAGTYTLINATGATLTSIDPATFELGTTIAGYTYSFSQTGNQFRLTASAIPEPAAFAALAGVLALGLVTTRRRLRAV
ncbi:MAG: autotransporter-associated beta strand repeat-containing protein [Rariglobus sp.]